MILDGIIIDILTQKENDWGRYKVETNDKKQFLAVGVVKNASKGMYISIDGETIVNQYGRQFKIKTVIKTKADETAGIRRFLAEEVNYFGDVKIQHFISLYGSEALSVLKSDSAEQALCMVKGVGSNTAKKIVKSYKEGKKYEDIYIFLNGTGTKNQVKKIYEKYGVDTVSVIRRNPYKLISDINGFGFSRVDSLALSSGIKTDSDFRIAAGAKFVMEEAQNEGHCYLPEETLIERLVDVLAPIKDINDISATVAKNILKAKDWLSSKENLIKKYNPSSETITALTNLYVIRKSLNEKIPNVLQQLFDSKTLCDDNGKIYLPIMLTYEKELAEFIKEMANKPVVRYINQNLVDDVIREVEFSKGNNFEITDEQRTAVYGSLFNRFSVLSGGPGRGKTTIIEIIAKTFIRAKEDSSESDILLLAPTGRAAQRMSEQTGYYASTVHREIYKFSSIDKDGETEFKASLKPENARPSGILVICDESSMLDLKLARDLLLYAKDCNLILVGDADQIPSVKAGNVLRDIIASNSVNCSILRHGHRNQGAIAYNAELINNGKGIGSFWKDDTFTCFSFSDVAEIKERVIADYLEKTEEYEAKDVLLCTPMKNRGNTCVEQLNKCIQERYIKDKNKICQISSSKIFYVKDRVMQTVNNYGKELCSLKDREKTGVFNGEKGEIIDIEKTLDDFIITVLFDDGYVAKYTSKDVAELVLAYATTLHKCQGSEAKCTMIVMTYGDYILMNKELFYTGVTRAKKECILYGEEQVRYTRPLSAFDIAVSKANGTVRFTSLKERLRQNG